MSNGADDTNAPGRLVQAFRLIRALLTHHKPTFFIAVGGAAVFAACTVGSAFYVRLIIDDIIRPRFDEGSVEVSTVAWILGGMILLGFVRATGVVVRRTWAGRTGWGVTHRLTGEVIDRLVAQPVTWHRRQSPGDLITRAGVDAEAATSVLNPLPFASGVVVLVVLSSIWLVVTDPLLGLAAVFVFPLLIVLNVGYQKRVDRFYNTAQDELGRLSAAVHESFDGVAVVKSFGAEERETRRLSVIAERLREARLQAVRLRSLFESLLDGIPSIVNILLLVGGAYRVRAGALTVGELTSFIYLFTLLVFPLRLIGFTLSELPHSLAGWNRIRSLLDQPLDTDPVVALGRGHDNGVVLEGVRFAHDERVVLDGVDAAIGSGRTVAVVGATGSGKTTMLHLIAGLVSADEGSVTVPEEGATLVFQEAFLLAGTVRENITLGAPVAEDAIEAALAVAEADFVHQLPEGLATEIGERGVGLSGGQRQRIALARALVRNPRVLLLDDTTSALDPSTEARVIGNLRAALTETTVVAVASRPSTIALADDVLFLDEGRVVAHGLHDELMESVPAYRALIEAFEHDRAALDAEFAAEFGAESGAGSAAGASRPGTDGGGER